MEATAAETAGETNARTKIAKARMALALAVSRARPACTAALAAAKIVLDRVTAYQTAQLAKLTTAKAPLFWFTSARVKQSRTATFKSPSENTKRQLSRGRRERMTGPQQMTLRFPIRLLSPSMEAHSSLSLMQAARRCSRAIKHSGAETFKVDGCNDWLNSNQASDSTSYTGLQYCS